MSGAGVAWYRHRWAVRLLLLFLLLYLGQNAVTSMFLKVTDFEWHLDHARALLHERTYDPGFVTYLPARFLLDALYRRPSGAEEPSAGRRRAGEDQRRQGQRPGAGEGRQGGQGRQGAPAGALTGAAGLPRFRRTPAPSP